MSFQIRHKEFGLYQGGFLGLDFWLSLSNIPEQGIYEFETEEAAINYINLLCSSKCLDAMSIADLSIEPFDREENMKLISLRAINF